MFKTRPNFTRNRFFRFIATVRFAIPALLVFACGMIYGTICESLYGGEYVRSFVYHTWWFYLIQMSLVVSLIAAVIDRIPFRKRLVGFYTIHASLITLMTGAAITHIWGIDGNIELERGVEPRSTVRLQDPLLYVSDSGMRKSLPLSRGESLKLASGAELTILNYFPFAAENYNWRPQPGAWFATAIVKNPRMTQNLNIGNQEVANFVNRADLGPLHLEVVTPAFFANLKKSLATKGSQFVLSYQNGKESYGIGNLDKPYTFKGPSGTFVFSKVVNTKMSLTFYTLKTPEGLLKFFPGFSPFPVTNHLQADTNSPYQFMELQKLREHNTVFITYPGGGAAPEFGFGKGDAWNFVAYQGHEVALPWMGLTVDFRQEKRDEGPIAFYEFHKPNKDDDGPLRVAQVRIKKGEQVEDLWVTNRRVHSSALGLVETYINASEFELPFALQLDRFKMDQVRGSDKPASYESFVKLTRKVASGTTNGAVENAHVYMNNPLKSDGFTLYQASYLQDDAGNYHSILSVNWDPGRVVKYVGSLLLVLGLIVHFLILYGYIKVGK